MATNIPPHNLNEVLDGVEVVIKPRDKYFELMNHIKGPDFPTAAEIHGMKGIKEAYHFLGAALLL